MAATIWRRQFTPRHVLLNTYVTTGQVLKANLVMTDAGYPRLSFPMTGSNDIAVVVPIGILSDNLPPADLKVRVRLHSQAGATDDYTLRAQFMARRPGLNGVAESFNQITSQFPTQALSEETLQDVEVSIPAGEARDNAQDGDSLYLLLSLAAPGGVSPHALFVETIDIWQETP